MVVFRVVTEEWAEDNDSTETQGVATEEHVEGDDLTSSLRVVTEEHVEGNDSMIVLRVDSVACMKLVLNLVQNVVSGSKDSEGRQSS